MKAGLIGKTLGHTASPAIHEKIYQAMGISGTYDVLEMLPDQLAGNMKHLAKDGYTGCNVTIPYKRDVMPYLTDISREARVIGAVNTIHFTNEGAFGYNTDYGGFGRSLEQAGIGVAAQECVVLGTGGAAGPSFSIWQTRMPSRLPLFPAIPILKLNSMNLRRKSEPLR